MGRARTNYTRPAVDPTFRSAALVYGLATVGVVLTGHLDGGTAGLLAIKDCGGVTIVQDAREAGASSMPSSALRDVAVDHRGTIAAIAALTEESSLAKRWAASDDASKDPGLREQQGAARS